MKLHRKTIRMRLLKAPVIGIAMLLAFGACVAPGADSQPPPVPALEVQLSPSVTPPTSPGGKRLAAELKGNGRWINTEPFTLESKRGNVVLIDFWTYSCINCIRTLPHLKEWHEKYRNKGLVIVGVHTPEFRFEENYDNVERAVADEGITWAVVQDNDRETWDAYHNVVWPSKYLIDQHGVMRHFYGGEGGYNLTEGRIRNLLEEAGADLTDIEFVSLFDEAPTFDVDPSFDISVESNGYRPPDRSGLEETYDQTFRDIQNADVTSELLLGYARGCQKSLFSNSKIADPLFCQSRDIEIAYQDSGGRRDHRLYIQGRWTAEVESLRHTREADAFEDYLLLRFASKSVNLVAEADQTGTKVLVTLDGEPLTESNRGEDVVIEADGRSFLHMDEARLYGVVDLPAYGTHEVKLSPDADGFVAYSITFGVYAVGP